MLRRAASRTGLALAAGVLIALGILTTGLAIYFLAFRPPLLPEDIRYIGGNPQALSPALRDWLGIVFHTWGGFIAGYGVMLTGVGVFMLTSRDSWLVRAIALSLVIVFGRFLYSNVVLSSDFLWAVVGFFALALTALGLFALAYGRQSLRRTTECAEASRASGLVAPQQERECAESKQYP